MASRTQVRTRAYQKRRRAVDLRNEGWHLADIAVEVGYSNAAAVSIAIREFLKQHPPEGVAEMRQRENDKLDVLERTLWGILRREHVIVSQGRIVGKWVGWRRDPDSGEVFRDDNGKPIAILEPLRDSGPEIQCLRELRACQERRAKLNGLDMPVRLQIEDGSVDQEIEALMAELGNEPVTLPAEHPG